MNRKLYVASLFALLFLFGNAGAKTDYKVEKHTSPDGKYTYTTVTNDPLKARIYTLKNGLTVYLSVNKDAPRIQTVHWKNQKKSEAADIRVQQENQHRGMTKSARW